MQGSGIHNIKISRPNIAKKNSPYKKVAKGMETQFIKYLLAQMRKTILKDKKDGTEMRYYTSLLDQEYANIMASRGGLGLQKMILDQVAPQNRQRQPVPKTDQVIKMYTSPSKE